MQNYVTHFELNDFSKALTKLSKDFGMVIVGELEVMALEDHEMSNYDYYAPTKSQRIEWELHAQPAPAAQEDET